MGTFSGFVRFSLMATAVITVAALTGGAASAGVVPKGNIKVEKVSFDPAMAVETAHAAPVNHSGTADEPAVMIDMKVMKADVPVILEPQTNRTLVPVRFVAEGLGARVSWDPYFRRVSIRTKSQAILLTVGVAVAAVNGQEMALDQAPFIRFDRVFVPLRFVAEVLGATVDWVGQFPPSFAGTWPGRYQVWIWHPDGYWGGRGMQDRLEDGNWFLR